MPNYRLKLTAPRASLEGPQLSRSVRQSTGGKMRRALRRLEVLALLAAIGACALVSQATASGQVPCDDVTLVDIQGMSVEIPGRGTVQLDHGAGFLSETGPADASPNWKITLVQDEVLRPAPLVSLRLVRFNANHVTGSGAWDHVFIY